MHSILSLNLKHLVCARTNRKNERSKKPKADWQNIRLKQEKRSKEGRKQGKEDEMKERKNWKQKK